eukprot:7033918-Lingulodinium_polyedra.AAC.1
MLEEGASLTPQNLINLRTLAAGSREYADVRRALLDMDTRAASILPDKAKTHSALHAEADIYATLDSIVEET